MTGGEVGIPIAFAAGLLSFLSPCVLPLVPSYLTFVTGMSLEDLEQGVNRRATLIHSLLFVLGFSTIFIVGGAAASFLGQFVRYWEVWIARVGGVIIILLGLQSGQARQKEEQKYSYSVQKKRMSLLISSCRLYHTGQVRAVFSRIFRSFAEVLAGR